MLVGLLAFQVFLNIAAYNAFLSGMNNVNLWLTGVILITFAGFFHLYRYAMAQSKNIPQMPPVITTKPLVSTKKPLEPTNGDSKPASDKPSQGQVTEPSVPEIKSDVTELDKDLNLGTSDLNKP